MTGDEPGQHAGVADEIDPEEFLRRMLAISPEDAAEAREDAAKTPRVDLNAYSGGDDDDYTDESSE